MEHEDPNRVEESTVAAEYCALFRKPEIALHQAHDLRKLEIELYWKRATYFWTIIAVTFAGFFYSPKDANVSDIVIIACLGFLFSLGWYLVNRASSWAQRIWEIRLRLLEDCVMGPLHKTVVKDPHRSWRDLVGPRDYSISRLNAVLSGAITLAWPLLILKTLSEAQFRTSAVAIFAMLFTALVAGRMVRLDHRPDRFVRDIDYHLIEYRKSRVDQAAAA